MSYTIRRVNYFYVTVKDQPGEAYQLLEELAGLGINLLAFASVPTGPDTTQMTIFPSDARDLVSLAEKSGMTLIGPYSAFLVQGKDELGALVDIHRQLAHAAINVYASNGVTNGKDSYGYIIYVCPEDYEIAARVLDV